MKYEWHKELSTLPIDIHCPYIPKNVDKDTREYISKFLEDGYVIIKNAVPQDIVKYLKRNILTGYDNKAYCNYYCDGEKVFEQFSTKATKYFNAEMKILDTHYFDRKVQKAIFSRPIRNFLKAMFGDTLPLAFQSLSFIKGSGQSIHDDRTFVRVHSIGNFIASWIALEDVREKSGELIYYPKSHKLTPHRFKDGSIWNFTKQEINTYSNVLVKKAENAGLATEKFYGKAGDVLFWHSGLLHGGTNNNSNLTRTSLVTHYCPYLNSYPPYLLNNFDAESHIRRTIGDDTITGAVSTGFKEYYNSKYTGL